VVPWNRKYSSSSLQLERNRSDFDAISPPRRDPRSSAAKPVYLLPTPQRDSCYDLTIARSDLYSHLTMIHPLTKQKNKQARWAATVKLCTNTMALGLPIHSELRRIFYGSVRVDCLARFWSFSLRCLPKDLILNP